MSITFPLPNDPGPQPTPSHSATSLDPPSTYSSAHDSIRPKAERRVSLGVLESAKFRLSHDFARLVRSSSSTSSKSARTGRTSSTHGSRALASDYENEPHPTLSHHSVDLDHHDMSPLFADRPPESLSRRAKFYGFLSRSSSRSRSLSKCDARPSDSASNESPDPLNATVTFTSISGTSDSHYATSPTSTSHPRSPSRPLSDNTMTTGDTVTPKKWQSRTSRASRAHHHARPISPHLINDSGIGVNEPLIAYDPRMPPPPVPASALLAQPTSTKEKRRSKPLFGLPTAPWSRPARLKNEEVSALPSPPQSPPSRPSGVSKIENLFRIGPPLAVSSSSRPPTADRQPSRPMTSPIPVNPADTGMRPHSSPPRIHDRPEIESSESERDGRCSPLLGLFTSARGRGKQRERNHDNLEVTPGKPVVGAPITRIRTASREGSNVSKGAGGAKLPDFEFEGDGSTDARRSTSHNGYKRVASPHVSGNAPAQTHAYHSRGHAHKHSHGQDARSHTRTHVRSRSHAHPARSHTHPQPNHQRTGSPPAAPNSPLMQSVTAASAASHSTTGTAATNMTTAAPTAGGTGSWGRAARTVDWVRGAGVHPPFAFESAASSTASTSGERRGVGGGGVCDEAGSGSDIRDRERERDRERSRRRIVAHAQSPVSPVRSTGTSTGAGVGTGRWEQREIELGLGLTWAPTKIRVREWTPGSLDSAGSGRTGAGAAEVIDGGGKDRNAQARALQREREMEKRVREREGARRTRERLAEYELGYMRSRSRTDREVTGRFRDVLGTEGFEAFKKYVRRFDAELIPLHGPSGLLGRVERLLDKTPVRQVGAREKDELLGDLVKIVHETEW